MTPNPDDPLDKSQARQRTLKFPDVLSERLDKLCHLLTTKGKHGVIERKDLVAALIAAAPEELDDLNDLIAEYREKKVRDALVGAEKDAKVIEFRPVKPGRRGAA